MVTLHATEMRKCGIIWVLAYGALYGNIASDRYSYRIISNGIPVIEYRMIR
jgi:hypothetical protein